MSAVQHEKASADGIDRTLLALGFALGIAGGLILGASYLADLPSTMLAAGWLLLFLGLAMAFAFEVRNARRENRSLQSSFGEGLRTLWSFFWAFIP